MHKNHPEDLSNIHVLMPIGGKATRAHTVTGDRIPKHLIKLGSGHTVLDTMLRGLQGAGFRRFIFCVGYYKDQLRDHIDSGAWMGAEDASCVFSEEERPLGVDGAVLKAIGSLGLRGEGLVVPGDMLLPWQSIAGMAKHHSELGTADITIGVTSHVTPRTTDVGRMIIEEETNRLVRCIPRDEEVPLSVASHRSLTSAAAMSMTLSRYVELCQTYQTEHAHLSGQPFSLRDQVLPWAVAKSDFSVYTYDLGGEALDLGTPMNIRYGQENWEQYV